MMGYTIYLNGEFFTSTDSPTDVIFALEQDWLLTSTFYGFNRKIHIEATEREAIVRRGELVERRRAGTSPRSEILIRRRA